MALSGEEIIAWTAAPDVRSALELRGIPESDALTAAAVTLRVGMVRDNLAKVLRGRYETAQGELQLAETALNALGLAPTGDGRSPEEEPDRFLTRADFRAQDGGSGVLSSRAWNNILTLKSELAQARVDAASPDISAEQRRLRELRLRELSQFEGLLIDGKVSLRKLRELEQAGAFAGNGFGKGSRMLIGRVATSGFGA